MDNEKDAIEREAGTKAIGAVDPLVSVPRSLTAANGAKAILMGEFYENCIITCPECEDDEDYGYCRICDSQGYINQKIPIQWDTIKRIYDKIVEHFAS